MGVVLRLRMQVPGEPGSSQLLDQGRTDTPKPLWSVGSRELIQKLGWIALRPWGLVSRHRAWTLPAWALLEPSVPSCW